MINNTFSFFSHEGVYVLDFFFFLRTKNFFSSMDTLKVKIVEYGVLKTHLHCMETHCIRLRLVFDALCR
jgi:hypothetical protein